MQGNIMKGSYTPGGLSPAEVELGTVLWENPNPTQEFSEQTITLSSDDYDYIIIDFIRRLADDPVRHISFRYEKRCGTHAIAKYDNGNTICDRQAGYIDDTHYLMGGCYTNGTLVNSSLIPVKIYGYKNTIPSVVQKESEVYSTGEQVIGEWINGKPIYRKTFDCGALPNNGYKEIAIGDLSIDFITDIHGVTHNPTDGAVCPLPNVGANDVTRDILLNYNTISNNIVIKTGLDRSGYTQTYVTIEYTKTTD